MAKIVKDTRETIDVDTELENLKNETNKRKTTKNVKKDVKKNNDKKKNNPKKKHFLGEVKDEMAKVKWPSKKDMIKYSIATIVFVVFFALFFYAIDMIIALLKEVS